MAAQNLPSIQARAKTLNSIKGQFHKCHSISDEHIVRLNRYFIHEGCNCD